jgi:hypothetical protein
VVGEQRILYVGVVVGIVIPEVSAVAAVLLILPHVGRRGTLHMYAACAVPVRVRLIRIQLSSSTPSQESFPGLYHR